MHYPTDVGPVRFATVVAGIGGLSIPGGSLREVVKEILSICCSLPVAFTACSGCCVVFCALLLLLLKAGRS